MTFTFQCVTCGKTHEGMPSFGASAPLSYYEVPVEGKAVGVSLTIVYPSPQSPFDQAK